MVSDAYAQLVSSPDDIVGLLTYALYKDSKCNYILKYKEKHGVEPNEQELDSFLLITLSPQNVQRLRHQALGLIESLLDDVASREIQQAVENYKQNQLELIDATLAKHKRHFGWDICIGVISAFIFALLASAFVFVKTYQAKTRETLGNQAKTGKTLGIIKIGDNSVRIVAYLFASKGGLRASDSSTTFVFGAVDVL